MQDLKNDLPFKNIRVLDISSVLAGPLAGSFFAELGAEVIKIENKLTGGDVTRQWKLPAESPDEPYSAYYFSANYGKQEVHLDLNAIEDRVRLHQYILKSDILISNFQKSVAEKLGVLPDDLHKKYPQLIIGQLSAYNFEDQRPGYDLVMQGETGWISMTGTDDNHLSKLPVALIDIIAAHQLKEAILIAMWKKTTSGAGSIVHVSLYDSALSALVNQASNYLMAGYIPKPLGTLHPNIAPYGDQFTDKYGIKFILAVGSDAQFNKLWFTLNLPIEKYPTFERNNERVKYRKLLQQILRKKFRSFSLDDISVMMMKEKIPFCAIKNLDQVFNDVDALKMTKKYTVDNIDVTSVSHIAFKIT
ncbi:MAG: CoA transferase [Saprospiraceae bacterium]|nr:CoA transferase [Saprospiraceae bacterium]